MKLRIEHKAVSQVASIALFLLLATDVARAEQYFVYLSSETRSTLIWCTIILAGGMVAAAIMRRSK